MFHLQRIKCTHLQMPKYLSPMNDDIFVVVLHCCCQITSLLLASRFYATSIIMYLLIFLSCCEVYSSGKRRILVDLGLVLGCTHHHPPLNPNPFYCTRFTAEDILFFLAVAQTNILIHHVFMLCQELVYDGGFIISTS